MFDTLTYYDSAAEMGTALKESIHKYARDAQSAEEDVPHVEALAARAEELLHAAPVERSWMCVMSLYAPNIGRVRVRS